MNIRKTITALTISLVATLGATIALSAQPAAAATSTTACFKYWDGATYANAPVQLMQLSGGRWVPIRDGRTGANGCGTFYNTPSNVTLAMRGYSVVGNRLIGTATFEGYAGRAAGPGTGGVLLGTGTVGLVACTWGTAAFCAGWA